MNYRTEGFVIVCCDLTWTEGLCNESPEAEKINKVNEEFTCANNK
jgi:20S proteasome alpha/beta subunit